MLMWIIIAALSGVLFFIMRDKEQIKMEKEVKSTFIGELIMEKLKDLDEVAYVRFASVYRQFTDVNTFISEIEKMLGTKRGGSNA